MAPRRSTARSARPSQPSSHASSSKVTLDDIPPADIPASITPDYVYQPRARRVLTEAECEKMVHELVGFHPRQVCDDIANSARDEILTAIGGVDSWANSKITDEDDEALQREINIGLYAAESLLESRIDREFDKYTAYMLRNPFEIKGERDYVLPWQAGLDFARGQHVTTLPKGQGTLDQRLEDLRTQTEQARLVSQRLEQAEKALERRLQIAKQRKAEVGFVKDVLSASGLSPLDEKASNALAGLTALHTLVAPMDPYPISSPAHLAPAPAPGSGAKAWEMGRQAYLNWAVGKLVPGAAGNAGDELLEGLECDMRAAGGVEGVEKLHGAAQ